MAGTTTDLCGGTGGNGQVTKVGSGWFNIVRNDGTDQVIHITEDATIKSSADPLSLFDLKSGDRVTLVGDPQPDGSFTAYAVFVCAKTGTTTAPAVRAFDTHHADVVISTVGTLALLFFGLLWLCVAAFLRVKKRKSFVYMLFFTIFFVYLYKVLDYTLLQFQSLLLLKHFLPDLMLNGAEAGKAVNLIPLSTLTREDLRTSLLNILLMMPFGFGLPFITNFRMKRVVAAGVIFSIAIELLQLATGLIGNLTFRVADINDLIFNTIGVVAGYIAFLVFIRVYRRVLPNGMRSNPILRYIAERPQVD